MRFINSPSLNKAVSYSPLIGTCLFVVADTSQIIQIYSKQSSLGHSIWGWTIVIISLLLYATFFKVKTPNEKLAFWCTILNLFVVILLYATVIYFR